MQNEIYKNGFLLGEWRVSPMQGELRGPSGSQHIEPKVMKLLLCLAERHGEVVERDTLIDVVWDGRVVSDEALFRCVAELRKRLGDSRKNPRYIRTVHKIGYQLVSAVSFEDADSKSVSSVDEPAILHWPHLQRFDNLEVIRHLGSGLMAHVHLARDIALERLVAIKTLRSDLNMSSNARQRFYREAKAAARLNHPNVTAIYRIGELSSDRPYIVQQFVEGKNLAELIEVEGALEIGYAISLLRELAAALAEAHHERIIHRDLKPGNILIEADSGRALLSDFGIAGIQETGRRDATQLTLAGEMLGEPRYMSPEQVRGEKATAQCDIYSYGLVAFEILSGRYAYDAPEPFDASKVHLHALPKSLRELRPDVPEEILRVVERSLDKDPVRRPTAEQLQRLLHGEVASVSTSQPPIFPDPSRRRLRHQRWLIGTATVLLVSLLAWVVFR